MKKTFRWLTILVVTAGVGLGSGALAGWARPNPPFDGHGRDRHEDRDSHDRGHDRREHWDHGRHRGWERDARGRYRFDSYDRREVVRYYREHRHERWFRERGPRGFALAYGRVIALRYHRYCRPLPPVMLRELPPPPPRCRYFLFAGNVVLVNGGYRVQDFIRLSFNIGH